MATLKIGRPELELIKQAGERLAYRTNSTFVLNKDSFDVQEVDVVDDPTKTDDGDRSLISLG